MPDSNLLNAFLSIAALFAALGILYFIVKKISKKARDTNDPYNLKIISKISLQPKANLYIVKVLDQTLLIGVTDHSASMLANLTGQEPSASVDTINGVINKQNISNSDSLSFRQFIKSSLKKTN